jgi:FMN reductase
MKILVIGCSLNPASRSHILGHELSQTLREMGGDVTMLDLRKLDLPLCEGTQTADVDSAVLRAVRDASAIVLCTPIYNFDVSPATRNLIALTGAVWADKVVGICAAAGGSRSFMSIMNLAGSLMLDFRCYVVPRFVYATHDDFTGDRLESPAVRDRLEGLARELLRVTPAITQAPVSDRR